MRDSSFSADQAGLAQGLAALLDRPKGDVAAALAALPESLPAAGQGEIQTLTQLAPLVLGGARHLGAETAFAHMDPPTPWIAWGVGKAPERIRSARRPADLSLFR